MLTSVYPQYTILFKTFDLKQNEKEGYWFYSA